MLERCPYYERCTVETRNIRGNNEYYCLGSINWEFCVQFKELMLSGETFQGVGKDIEISQIGRTIYKNLRSESQLSLIIALITYQGEILYRDRQWTEVNLLVAQNLIRYKSDSIEISEFFELENEENFLFIKIHRNIILVCMTRNKLGHLIKIIIENLSEYGTLLDKYLDTHPILDNKEATMKPEKKLIVNLLINLQEKLEAINPTMVIRDLYKIQEKISEFFSWNRIFYEIAILIESLEKYPAKNKLTNREREEILGKVREWQKKINQIV